MKLKNASHQLAPSVLVEQAIIQGQGKLSSTGALVVDTGTFTGRSPKDRYVVKDAQTEEMVDWGDVNIPIEASSFDALFQDILAFMEQQEIVYSRDGYACANPNYKLGIRFYTEYPWQSLFIHNMFIRPTNKELQVFEPDWKVYAFPSVLAIPEKHATRQSNFSIINFSKKTVIIGGTAYTGEIKKGIFSVLNCILPTENNVLPMHCSANVGEKGDTALFFGLSGTGKTTLSNDPDRRLIGDDEHGWSKESVFNFEGGCYAKTIDLSPSKEPMIFKAIKFGALLENVGFQMDSTTVDYRDVSKTQNTRVSYPIYHIDNIMFNSRGDVPENVFFLTCDAFGILPPIARLDKAQAMYHFLSGYTAKIAGTEAGIDEPEPSFSACFGAPFLPLHPTVYAKLLGEKLEKGSRRGDGQINVWLINTGWTGGPYGKGNRIELSHTRAIVKAALEGALNEVEYQTQAIFNLQIPKSCPDVPNAILNPRDTWPNENEYDKMAATLAARFQQNFAKYSQEASQEILAAAPRAV